MDHGYRDTDRGQQDQASERTAMDPLPEPDEDARELEVRSGPADPILASEEEASDRRAEDHALIRRAQAGDE